MMYSNYIKRIFDLVLSMIAFIIPITVICSDNASNQVRFERSNLFLQKRVGKGKSYFEFLFLR